MNDDFAPSDPTEEDETVAPPDLVDEDEGPLVTLADIYEKHDDSLVDDVEVNVMGLLRRGAEIRPCRLCGVMVAVISYPSPRVLDAPAKKLFVTTDHYNTCAGIDEDQRERLHLLRCKVLDERRAWCDPFRWRGIAKPR